MKAPPKPLIDRNGDLVAAAHIEVYRKRERERIKREKDQTARDSTYAAERAAREAKRTGRPALSPVELEPAPGHAHRILGLLEALDKRLRDAGWPAISSWWWNTLSDFYCSGLRELVLRVARRGGKTTTLARVGVCEICWGDHAIPPGDVGIGTIISVSRPEGVEVLRVVERALRIVGQAWEPADNGINLTGINRGFRVWVPTLGGVVGRTCVWALCDEAAYWRDRDTQVNPATEVLASLRPTMADQPNAKLFLASAPQGRLDAHAKAFDEGRTARQMVASAATWVARPELTEELTHTLETNESVWKRAYAAIPMEGTLESLLSPALLDRATRPFPGDVAPEPGVTYVAAQDPGFTRNAWTLVVAAKRFTCNALGERLRRSVVLCREWRGTAEQPLDPERVLREIAALLRPYKVRVVETDQYEQFGLRAIGARVGLEVVVRERSSVERLERWEQLSVWLADGEVELPPDPVLRADLLAVRRRLTPNGFSVWWPETPDGRHADYAPATVIALSRATVDPELPARLPAAYVVPAPPNAAAEAERLEAAVLHKTEQVDRPWWDNDSPAEDDSLDN